ncbi:MAG: SurA N-terminal domain-containing protein, partial [Deltaproteobacteria bacterium]|nr:SurA N-terminal domain-containing protein [Deltaproteobacteria bacterium]
QNTYSSIYQLYQNIYQDQFTPALESQLKLAEKSITSLIDEVLMQGEAERLQIDVSSKELVESIAQIQAFQENGVFSKDRYLEVLAYQRMNSDEFEAMQHNELVISPWKLILLSSRKCFASRKWLPCVICNSNHNATLKM